MTLSELVPWLKEKNFRRVFVTGSPRSGTKIATRILADELDFTFHQEEEVGIRDLKLAKEKSIQFDGSVWQAPGLCYATQEITDPNTAIVFMLRDEKDILASMKRIGWTDPKKKLSYIYEGYRTYFVNDKGKVRTKYNGPKDLSIFSMPELTIRMWFMYQLPLLEGRCAELIYSSMAGHPRWVEKNLRQNFGARDIEIAKPRVRK